MNAVFDPANKIVTVLLSRRNLLALLHKLDMPGSQRTLVRNTPTVTIVAVAEDDDVHYDGRLPGVMHPATETFIAERVAA